ncbi:MAG: glucosamine-6-phosphate deaminase [Planctomycetaceae bacterium]|nr:glucosamine-6-phosphate deaminase [Planctomycetaceae bacterium]
MMEPKGIERLTVRIFSDSKSASKAVAARVARVISSRNARGQTTVLGLATGHTPVNVYRELIRLHRQEGLDFSSVVTFNLDEYWPIPHDALQSYHRWMHENLLDHVNIKPENIHIPSGEVAEDQLDDFCHQYEQAIIAAGGIDFQILGIGRSGHIGFNEPGSHSDSRTRRIHLDAITRKDAAGDFFGEEHVPQFAITMGVGSILEAREIAMLAFGEHKAPMIRRAIEEEVSIDVAASFLQEHPASVVYIDQAAAADLTRVATPWKLGHCEWNSQLTHRAVVWLAQKLDKPILRLVEEDYAENGLAELVRSGGGAYKINLEVFRHLMATITGWPGGKNRKRRVLILSPHPDDDVISMGGTMARFVEQGHEVHTAYMVSGYLSVFDHDVARYAEFVAGFNRIFGLTPEQTGVIEEHIEQFLRRKKPGQVDSPEIQQIKGLIRQGEAIDAARFCGLVDDNIHFLNMPFYNTGRVQKLEVAPEDIAAVETVLEQVRPDMVFAAGDLSDPHGTHRLCLDAAMEALARHKAAGKGDPEIWLYRGAWQEWAIDQIDMAVPLSPDELRHKRFTIFRHQSQKDRAMFPGPYDSREFWQRAEERNMTTAKTYDALGLPEYHAIEAFARHPARQPAQRCVEE